MVRAPYNHASWLDPARAVSDMYHLIEDLNQTQDLRGRLYLIAGSGKSEDVTRMSLWPGIKKTVLTLQPSSLVPSSRKTKREMKEQNRNKQMLYCIFLAKRLHMH